MVTRSQFRADRLHVSGATLQNEVTRATRRTGVRRLWILYADKLMFYFHIYRVFYYCHDSEI